MNGVIYLDALITVNFAIDYYLLLSVAALARLTLKRSRILLASLLGAAFSLVILLPSMNAVIGILLKAASAYLISLTAFGFKSIKRSLLNAAWLFGVSSLFAGAVLLVDSVLSNDKIFSNNGSIYISLSPLRLVIIAVGVYLVLLLAKLLNAGKAESVDEVTAIVEKNESETVLKAMYDSGHRLREVVSGRSVVIVRERLAEKLLDASEKKLYENSGESGASALAQSRPGTAYLVPYSTVDGEGIFVGFPADSCRFTNCNKFCTLDSPLLVFSKMDGVPEDIDAIVGYDCMKN